MIKLFNNFKQVSLRKLLETLEIGESVIVTANNETSIASIISRFDYQQFTQKKVIITHPELCQSQPGWIVTRIV